MKNKECTSGPSYCQICGKEMLRNHTCVDCNNKLKIKKKKPKNK